RLARVQLRARPGHGDRAGQVRPRFQRPVYLRLVPAGGDEARADIRTRAAGLDRAADMIAQFVILARHAALPVSLAMNVPCGTPDDMGIEITIAMSPGFQTGHSGKSAAGVAPGLRLSSARTKLTERANGGQRQQGHPDRQSG